MTFAEAVHQAPEPVARSLKPGKQALGRYSAAVECDDSRRFVGSIALDSALAATLPEAPRWDFGLGLKCGNQEAAVWLEVHTATTSEVPCVLAKLSWLKKWLAEQAPALWGLTGIANPAFLWLATDAGVHIRPGSPQALRLNRAGLGLPRKTAVLGT
ncbi:MAG TPA: hypothetical protein P5234_03600 [Thermoanaerobaculaceae bacterium]|nr:hypothetical protein [Thermoanaerobaculaceae bacterium]HRS15317.1 hypothetical protein [Thermoanaerobaculaceae bacterium]